MRVVIFGGRRFGNKRLFANTMVAFEREIGKITFVIEGNADGADAMGKRWAQINRRGVLTYAPIWEDLHTMPVKIKTNKHGARYNSLATLVRNQRMVDEGKLDYAIMFPGESGTADMARRLKAAGVKIFEARYEV